MRDNTDRSQSSFEEEVEEKAEEAAEKEVERERRKRKEDPLDVVVQSEFVELPSKGRFYGEDSPLFEQEEIEIREMTAKEEDILSNKELVQKRKALDRVLNNIIQDPKINVEQFLVGDKSALIVEARKSSYGSLYEVDMTCQICANTQRQEYDIEEETEVDYGGPSEEFPADYNDETNTFFLELPKTELEIEFRLLKVRDVKRAQYKKKKKEKHGIDSYDLTEQMKMYVESINGYQKKMKINKTIEKLPAKDAKYLRAAYQDIQPNKEMTTFFECNQCGFQTEQEVPLRREFFWPD